MSDWKESDGDAWKGGDPMEEIARIFERLAEAFSSPEAMKKFNIESFAKGNSYILKNEIFRKAKTLEEFSMAFAIENRRVALDKIDDKNYVSTVFLGIDHNFGGHGGPILFETMAWYKGEDYEQRRYPTFEAALTGHKEVLDSLKIAVMNNL